VVEWCIYITEMLFKSTKAPRVGFESTTSRLIPMDRDSTIEQIFANPLGGLHLLNSSFKLDRVSSCIERLVPDEFPRAVFVCESDRTAGSIIVFDYTAVGIV
jgi:hypothetical protein